MDVNVVGVGIIALPPTATGAIYTTLVVMVGN
jgi:hypothetical protein